MRALMLLKMAILLVVVSGCGGDEPPEEEGPGQSGGTISSNHCFFEGRPYSEGNRACLLGNEHVCNANGQWTNLGHSCD